MAWQYTAVRNPGDGEYSVTWKNAYNINIEPKKENIKWHI